MNKKYIGGMYLSLASSIWGGTFVVSKYILNYIPPLTLITLRYILAVLALFIFIKFISKEKLKKITKKDGFLFLLIGFIGYFLSISLQFLGTKLTDAHTGSVLTASTPAFTIIFAKLILKEKITLKKFISLLIASIGVLVVIGYNGSNGFNFLGDLALIGAAITWALLSVLVKIASKNNSSLIVTAYAIFIGLFFTIPFTIFELKSTPITHINLSIILGVIYIGVISTAIAFFLWNKGLEMVDTGIGSLFFFFQPLVGSFLGWFLLNEKLGMNFFIGGVLILSSIFVVSYEKTPELIEVKE
ncbi:MAG: EamA family transporter [Fusobacteriaceae bacterium]|nr:EamA family transporter [Fusobacteriaceae bacterium]MBN2839173.1 EamA family transporter [Fusobacteriaceae bacterium]